MESLRRKCVVTGGVKGIGKSIALALSDLGADVFVIDIDDECFEAQNVNFIRADVCDWQSMKNAAEAISHIYNNLDVLIVNAGISRLIAFDNLNIDEWERTIKVNLTGSFITVKCFMPLLKKSEVPRIIFISSASGITGSGGGAHYASSKSGQHGLMRALAREYGKHGFRVNAIAPRTIKSEILDSLYPPESSERGELTQKIPVGRLGLPQDIADFVCFLSSDKASFIHGQILLLDGGRTFL